MVLALAVNFLGERNARASVGNGRTVAPHPGIVVGRSADITGRSLTVHHGCGPEPRSAGYVNPLAHAAVKGERIDQGVDYAGHGSLVAIGAARVSYVGLGGTGWPGAFVSYRLLSGPDAGCFIYYAEGVQPDRGLHVGETVRAGQTVATIIPGWSTGIELGWAAGHNTTTFAGRHGGWTATDDADSVPSAAGRSFSLLISDLGGPPGRVEG